MPGEQPTPGENGEKHVLPPKREPPIGQVIDGIEFQQFADARLVRMIGSLADPAGQYTLFFVQGLGLAMGNDATRRVFLIDSARLLAAARIAGVDEEAAIIVHSGQGGARHGA
jgi:hypothetical protein